MRAAVITASDRCFEGAAEDVSGALLRERLEESGAELVSYALVPDDVEDIAHAIRIAVDEHEADLVITTGGTGLGPRDVTPEATRDVIEREVPGIAERIRAASLEKSPNAALSRAIAGQRAGALIVNLPGSPKAVEETLPLVLDVAEHALRMMAGEGH
jgi:molybdenum cofactor synthesis domain-containing protein